MRFDGSAGAARLVSRSIHQTAHASPIKKAITVPADAMSAASPYAEKTSGK
jgi:hypothetical protein